jgi:hypothetical protein
LGVAAYASDEAKRPALIVDLDRIPSQSEPTEPVAFEVVKTEGQGSLAARASAKLAHGGQMYAAFPPTLLRLRLDNELSSMWADGHVVVSALADAFARYVYLPRLRDSNVMLESVSAGPSSLAWQSDGFAVADAYDDSAGRYVGLTVASRANAAATSLVVRPDVAAKQLEAETAEPSPQPTEGKGADDIVRPPDSEPGGPSKPRRFHATITLDAGRPLRSFEQVFNEVLQHLTTLHGTDVSLTLDVDARHDEGFPDTTVRTVTENSSVLKFDNAEFEAD